MSVRVWLGQVVMVVCGEGRDGWAIGAGFSLCSLHVQWNKRVLWINVIKICVLSRRSAGGSSATELIWRVVYGSSFGTFSLSLIV